MTVHAAPGSLGKITFGGLRGQDWVGLRFERRKIFLDPARLASSYHLDSIGMPFVPPSLGVIATPAMASAVEKSPADQKTLDFGHKSVAEHPRQGQVLWAIETIRTAISIRGIADALARAALRTLPRRLHSWLPPARQLPRFGDLAWRHALRVFVSAIILHLGSRAPPTS